MPGFANADNKFGPTDFIVGPVLGAGCNFTSIQSAINAAAAVGGEQSVLIRIGSYTEDLTLAPLVNLKGWATESNIEPQVLVTGNHTINFDTVSLNIIYIEEVSFTGTGAGPILTISSDPATSGSVIMQNCGMVTSNASSVCVSLDADPSNSVAFYGRDCDLNSVASCIFSPLNEGDVFLIDSSVSSTANAISIGGSGSLLMERSDVFSLGIGVVMSASGAARIDFCNFNTTGSCISVDSSVINTNSVMNTNVGTGFFVTTSTSGNYLYANIINRGTANGIDPALSATVFDWKPYAASGASPGTSVVRGTSCFNSAQFSVTNGFVSLTGSGGTSFSEATGAFSIARDNGYYVTAPASGTLPTTGLVDGDLVEIVGAAGVGIVVQATAPQVIRIGSISSSSGGTATSTAVGDTLVLRYRSANTTFYADSVIGNWVLA